MTHGNPEYLIGSRSTRPRRQSLCVFGWEQHMTNLARLASLLVTLAATACGEDPSGPVFLAPVYQLDSADGMAMPIRSLMTLTNAGSTCVYDLVGGELAFYGSANYSLSVAYDVRCAGNPVPSRDYDVSEGKYTQVDGRLVFTPRTYGEFAITRATASSNMVTIDIRTNSGRVHRFDFTAAPLRSTSGPTAGLGLGSAT